MHRCHRLAILSTAFVMVVGVAPMAHADDSSSTTPLPVAEPFAPVQSKAEATIESVTVSQPIVQNDLGGLRASGAAAIAKRQATLSDLTAKVATQTKDCGFNATVQSEVARTSSSLNSVGVALATTTDLASAKLFYGQIFTAHRVYLVVAPKVQAALRCNAQLSRNDALLAEAAKLQLQIDAAAARGVNVATAQAAKNAAVAQIATINPTPAVANVMGIVPDKGDKTVQAANAAAFTAVDAALDASLDSQKAVNRQLDTVRRALRGDIRVDRIEDRFKDKAEKEAKKAAERAEKEARKATKRAEKDAERVLRDARKIERRAQKEQSGDDEKD